MGFRVWLIGFALSVLLGCREPVIRDIDEFFSPPPDPCATCREPAGENHLCGETLYCSDCGYDAHLKGHLCGNTRFCKRCGKDEVPGHHQKGPDD